MNDLEVRQEAKPDAIKRHPTRVKYLQYTYLWIVKTCMYAGADLGFEKGGGEGAHPIIEAKFEN